MTFKQYSEAARATAIYDDASRIIYPALGLVSEAGEVAGKLKKIIRDRNGEFSEEDVKALVSEIGDVLWYCSTFLEDIGSSLEEAAKVNVDKLKSRAERGVLGGSGDNR